MAQVNTIPIKNTIDEEGDQFYPATKTDAVFDDDGNSVEYRLTHIITDTDWAAIQARLT